MQRLSFVRLLTALVLAVAVLTPPLSGAGPVDINTADARTLAKELKGIGPARAEAIVAYRSQHGPFKSADDLGLVKGIAQRVIDQNRENIRTGSTGRSETAGTRTPDAKPDTAKSPAAPATRPNAGR